MSWPVEMFGEDVGWRLECQWDGDMRRDVNICGKRDTTVDRQPCILRSGHEKDGLSCSSGNRFLLPDEGYVGLAKWE